MRGRQLVRGEPQSTPNNARPQISPRKVQTPRKEKIKPSWGITVEKEDVAMSETGDVKITQYLRPSGMKRPMTTSIGACCRC